MQSMQLYLLSLVLTCVRLSDARFLSVRGPTFPQVEDQKPAGMEAESGAKPERGNSRESARQTADVLQRRTWPELNPLTWKFPNDPVEPKPKAPVKFEPQQQKKERIAVRCGEGKVQVEVSQDLPGLSRNVKPEEMTLGGCSATDVDDLSHVLVFESQLHRCGSRLVMTEDAFIYAFTLVFKPRVLSRGGIIRSQSAIIGVECHYSR